MEADCQSNKKKGFHPLPEEIVLWPLEEMFRRRVIAFLVDQELLPRDRAEMLLSWRPDRPPGSPKRARTSERSPKRR